MYTGFTINRRLVVRILPMKTFHGVVFFLQSQSTGVIRKVIFLCLELLL